MIKDHNHYFSNDKLRSAFEKQYSKAKIRTAGSDRVHKVDINKLDNIFFQNLSLKLKTGCYKPRKFRIMSAKINLVNVGNDRASFKYRIIANPSNYDYPVFTILKDYLNDLYNNKANKLKITNDFYSGTQIKCFKDYIMKLDNDQAYYFISADFDSFFANVEHDELFRILKDVFNININMLINIKKIFEVYKRSFNVDDNDTTDNSDDEKAYDGYNTFEFNLNLNKGIPQGLPISSILAKMYLYDINTEIKKHFGDVKYYKYVDDFIFIIKKNQLTDETLIEKFKNFNYKGIRFNKNKLKVSLSLDKDFNDKGIKFLGYEVYKTKHSFDVRTSKDAVNQFINRLELKFSQFKRQETINKKLGKFTKEEAVVNIIKFITEINLMLTGFIDDNYSQKHQGWLGYYSLTTDLDGLSIIDSCVDKFKKRNSSLKNVEFKKILNAYRIIKKRDARNFYIPHISEIIKDENLMFDFLYNVGMLKYEVLKKMDKSQLEAHVNNIIYNRKVNESKYDVKRGLVIYG